jgi:protein-S-isoprenylcysteine O-methyltransferase Ste14
MPIPPLTLLISLALASALHFAYPIVRVVPFPLNLIGVLPVLLGALIVRRTRMLFAQYRTPIHPRGTPTALITTGPFRFTRNPIYLSFLLVAVGWAGLLGSLSAFIAPILFFAVVNPAVIPYEEAALRRSIGRPYEEYQQRVRRWL